MICGLITIFIAHEWRWLGPKPGSKKNTSSTAIHTLFGVLSVGIAFIQPFNSLLRCQPNNPNRKIFNWIHRSLGLLGWLFAATTITIACKYFGKHFSDNDAALSLVSAFLAFVGASVIISEIFRYKYNKMNQALSDEEPFAKDTIDIQKTVHPIIFYVFVSVSLTVSVVFIMLIKGA